MDFSPEELDRLLTMYGATYREARYTSPYHHQYVAVLRSCSRAETELLIFAKQHYSQCPVVLREFCDADREFQAAYRKRRRAADTLCGCPHEWYDSLMDMLA